MDIFANLEILVNLWILVNLVNIVNLISLVVMANLVILLNLVILTIQGYPAWPVATLSSCLLLHQPAEAARNIRLLPLVLVPLFKSCFSVLGWMEVPAF